MLFCLLLSEVIFVRWSIVSFFSWRCLKKSKIHVAVVVVVVVWVSASLSITFLDSSSHLYERLYPSVGASVHPLAVEVNSD